MFVILSRPQRQFFHKGPVARSFDVFLYMHIKGGWTHHGIAGDFRRFGGHVTSLSWTKGRPVVIQKFLPATIHPHTRILFLHSLRWWDDIDYLFRCWTGVCGRDIIQLHGLYPSAFKLCLRNPISLSRSTHYISPGNMTLNMPRIIYSGMALRNTWVLVFSICQYSYFGGRLLGYTGILSTRNVEWLKPSSLLLGDVSYNQRDMASSKIRFSLSTRRAYLMFR